MSEQQSSYRQIFKATSIFGGVQVFQIILSIVRSKLVAVLLGAQGMGVSGLLLSVTTLITSITSMGISTSAVRNVSEANQIGDQAAIARVVAVVKKLTLLTGLLGAVVTLVLSPWLSEITFGDGSYTFSFMALSVTFILGSLASGQTVLLQGLRKLSYLAKSNVLGAAAGLLVSVPLYYVYGLQGIVPAIIATGLVTVGVAYFFGSKLAVQSSSSVSFKEAWKEGEGMVRMGIMLSLSAIIAGLVAYVVRIFIGRQGGIADVGLFNAGFAIVHTYVGMVFTAMSIDYYPRLSAGSKDIPFTNKLVNQQAEMALLILAPILILLLMTLKLVIVFLYSKEFIGTVDMVQWAILAIFFKAVTWSVGFLLLAKGNTKIFFWNELIVNSYTLGLNVVGYSIWGLEGLGISFLAAYFLATVQNVLLANSRYTFSLGSRVYLILFIQGVMAILCLILNRSVEGVPLYAGSFILLLLSSAYSIIELNKMLGLRSLFEKYKSKLL